MAKGKDDLENAATAVADLKKLARELNEIGPGTIPAALRISKEQERLDSYQQESQLELLYKDVDLLRKERDHYRQALQDAHNELSAEPGKSYHYHVMGAQVIIEKGLGI